MSPNGAAVVVADHEPEVGELSRRYLARAGLSVRVVASPGATLAALSSGSADLFVIDVTMPGLEVPAVRRALQSGAPGGQRPVVFLLDRHGARPRGLVDGLDCRRLFLARPFSPRALVDAVTELLRPVPAAPPSPQGRPGGQSRAPGIPGGGLPGAGLRLDGDHRRVTVGGTEVDLTRTEFALLAALAGQPGRALTRQLLLAAVEAERGKRPTARAIDVYITQLRAKLGADIIQTVHGVGYVLHAPGGRPCAPPGGDPVPPGDDPLSTPGKGGRPPFHPPPQGNEHKPLAPGPPAYRAGEPPVDPGLPRLPG